MNFWFSFKNRGPSHAVTASAGELDGTVPYIAEFIAAIDRTERFGFETRPRFLVEKECVDLQTILPVLLDYYDQHSPDELVGQTAAIHFALLPRLYQKTGIPFELTIGWMEREGKLIFRHDEELIRRFVRDGRKAWMSEGCPFHLWMTSPACEILDITYAMNLGQARTRKRCPELIVYQRAHESATGSVYHPTLVGPGFFKSTGAIL